MKQRRKIALITFVCVMVLQISGIGVIAGKAAEKGIYFASGNLYYHAISKSKVEVCGTKKTTGTLKIPANVTYKGVKYKVTKIADYEQYSQDQAVTKESINGYAVAVDCAGYHYYRYDRVDGKSMPAKVEWLSCTNITKLVLPGTITYIGEGAFSGCSRLKTVQFAKKYTSLVIGKNAFGDNSISSMVFPEGTTELKENAAGNAKTVTIPATVKKIGSGVVHAGIQKVTIQSKNKNYKMKAGILYTKNEKKLVGVSGKAGKDIKISDKTTAIGEKAFSGTSVKTVALNSKITNISKGAFYNCKNLVSVSKMENVTTIGYAAFAQCPKLTGIGSDKKLTKIERAAFWGDSKLTFDIPVTLSDIDSYAFSGTVADTRLNLTVAQNHPVYTVENDLLIKTTDTEKIVMMQLADAENIVVPEGVTDVAVAIGTGKTKSITFPASLVRQEGKVCIAEGTMTYQSTAVPKFGADYGICTKGKTTVFVPVGTLQEYKKTISDLVWQRDDCEIWDDNLTISE